jgi:hypothetical protein
VLLGRLTGRSAAAVDRQVLPVAVWLTIALLAFGARLLPTLHGGGLGGLDDYDEGVYFAGAQALVAGRLPYRDFVLLHPPGILLLLSPFAVSARVLSDSRAFELARLAFMAVGALNAVLTAAVARRGRLGGLLAAVVAGVLYAVWPPAIDAESTTLLTPWNTLGLLVALLLLYRRGARPHQEFLAGVALGAATAVKIWGVVPLAVVLLWELLRRRSGSAAREALGAAAGATVVCLPFFLAAPTAMFRMIVVDQLERGEANAGLTGRVAGILGVAPFGSGARPPHWLLVAAVAVLCALVLSGAVLDRAWLVTTLLAALVALLLTEPSFFAHYAAYPAAPLLILAGAGSGALAALARERIRTSSGSFGSRWLLVVPLALTIIPPIALAGVVAGLHRGAVFPGQRLHQALASSRCVTSDAPGPLIAMDVLGRDLERHCRVWVDVTGLTYDAAGTGARYPNGDPVPRHLDRVWQRALLDYLLSGNATILIRRSADGLAPDTARTIAHLPVLARVAGHTLWQVPAGR